MSHEFNESEMCMCDYCKDWFPVDETYQLPDGHIVCEECMEQIQEDVTFDM